jgi:starch-binding outer membrane protein SusE/F
MMIKKNDMKYNKSKLFIVALSLLLGIIACTKVSNTFYQNGNAPTLTGSTTTIAPTPSDSLSQVLSLSWTDPMYATTKGTEKYTIQFDSSGRNFSKAVNVVVSGVLTDTFTAKQINTIALGFGFFYNVTYSMDVRVVSSYANNNEQLNSNTLTISVTPYVVPPKVPPPITKQLFLVGSATPGGWANPVPVPTQQFEEIDSVDYGGVFNIIGGQQYLILPKNGDWTNKYAVADNTVPGLNTGGGFGYNLSQNFPGPDSSGLYKIMVNFQAGTFTVTPYTQVLPDSLFLVGSATAGGWNNPVPEPSQVFKQINSTQFSISLHLLGGNQYLMLPVNGDWTNKFAVANGNVPASGGPFGYNLSTNFNGPVTDGNYTIIADFLNYQYTLTSP